MNNQNDLQALENIERQWAGIVHAARSQDKTTSAILNSTSNVRPIKVERNVVTLEVSSQFFFDKLHETSHRNVLEKSLETATGIGYSLID